MIISDREKVKLESESDGFDTFPSNQRISNNGRLDEDTEQQRGEVPE